MSVVKARGRFRAAADHRAAAAAPRPVLWRRLLSEAVGTGLLVTVVVGSGIAAQRLSPGNVGLQLLENSTATVFGLAVLILVFGPVSGAHFNPAISAADWFLGRRTRGGLPPADVLAYTLAQVVGGILGALLANLMYGLPAVQVSTHQRASWSTGLAEVVATAGLVAVVFALARTGRGALAAAAVGAYIGSAYWFTSSTSFANPAVTIGRIFSNTFGGIAPGSVPVFVLAQAVGGMVGMVLVLVLYPDVATREAAAAAADHAVAVTDLQETR
jgi:glycerol uptake facilitator-like aquaporin